MKTAQLLLGIALCAVAGFTLDVSIPNAILMAAIGTYFIHQGISK